MAKTNRKTTGRRKGAPSQPISAEEPIEPVAEHGVVEEELREVCSFEEFPLLLTHARAIRDSIPESDDPREAATKSLIWLENFTAELDKLKNMNPQECTVVMPPPSAINTTRKRPVPGSGARGTVDKKMKSGAMKTYTKVASASSPAPSSGRPRRQAAVTAQQRITYGNQTILKSSKTSATSRRGKKTPQSSLTDALPEDSSNSDVVIVEKTDEKCVVTVVASETASVEICDTSITVVTNTVVRPSKPSTSSKSSGAKAIQVLNSRKSSTSGERTQKGFFGNGTILSPIQRLQDETVISMRSSMGPVTSTPNSDGATMMESSPKAAAPSALISSRTSEAASRTAEAPNIFSGSFDHHLEEMASPVSDEYKTAYSVLDNQKVGKPHTSTKTSLVNATAVIPSPSVIPCREVRGTSGKRSSIAPPVKPVADFPGAQFSHAEAHNRVEKMPDEEVPSDDALTDEHQNVLSENGKNVATLEEIDIDVDGEITEKPAEETDSLQPAPIINKANTEAEVELNASMATLSLNTFVPPAAPVIVAEFTVKEPTSPKFADQGLKRSVDQTPARIPPVPARTLSPVRVEDPFVNAAKTGKSVSQTELPKTHFPSAAANRAGIPRVKDQSSAQKLINQPKIRKDAPPSNKKTTPLRPAHQAKPLQSAEKNIYVPKPLPFGGATPSSTNPVTIGTGPGKSTSKAAPLLKNGHGLFSTSVVHSVIPKAVPVSHPAVNPHGLNMGKKIIQDQREASKNKTSASKAPAMPSLEKLGSGVMFPSHEPTPIPLKVPFSAGMVRAPKVGNLAGGSSDANADGSGTDEKSPVSQGTAGLIPKAVAGAGTLHVQQMVTSASSLSASSSRNNLQYTNAAAQDVLAKVSDEYTDYGLDIAEDDDTDDEERPRRDVPSWAAPENLRNRIRGQLKRQLNLDEVFEGARPEEKVDLSRIFGRSKDRYNRRNSSQVWPHGVLPLGTTTPLASADLV
ncbi:mediator of DNA damage checkpoint protein 1-like [Paramacrobiotus metropolitanus]|uniref:mediator of DNA damage checkpoint protein 1-like n=1 Tax=Paramacrobiotus metropolitanus TaxID=2943436 RepID=UPI0024456814|nr:mediator of DNA damage checkpoint protein 1-like [Paramacrobiotus metropolitanus]